ncbi:hypothetical protein vBBak6_100 [Bacillus phage v_B-Bak6]|uniref:Uncharacterized protein n=2 Tax=Basiliskvirus TaxID=3044670 RepID=A0A385IK19_9CAUD|nr:hypothetical protein PP653_gp056 [Bacillus phage Basilisk]YP_010657003.1 hypothetical protein PP654_gp046 [Bacillus phage v_B-Bak10]AXY83060.1 hypothetical protein vBBak1_100 [Bacillus phage v_B-Bak1]AXY83180.1 hypothetical protein vBBak6_100 [Bacillus phage v_B-Bak6]AGR46649.1 hypothetical protein BASILISK_111 [Bacillus phage Basilisk]AXY83257.1 hypothetical protein vBBBak10_096 [Bacillus phage v_B-Bak10]
MIQTQSHELIDKYKIQDGLIVEVLKYESLGGYYYNKLPSKRLSGCKGGTVLTEDYTDNVGRVLPKGTTFLGTTPVRPITNVDEFRFEIRVSGGCIHGEAYQIESVLNDIQYLIKSYKDGSYNDKQEN